MKNAICGLLVGLACGIIIGSIVEINSNSIGCIALKQEAKCEVLQPTLMPMEYGIGFLVKKGITIIVMLKKKLERIGCNMKEIVVCADFFIKCKKKDLPKIYKKLTKALKDLKLDKSRSGISFYEKICEEG